MVQRRAVGRHGHDHVVGAHLVVLGGLDGREHVADARQAQGGQVVDRLLRHPAPLGEVGVADLGVEEDAQLVGRPVGDRQRHVRGHHVVDQRDVLVADALDVVLAEPVAEHRRTLERLDRDGQGARLLLEVIAGADRPSRAGGGGEGPQTEVRLLLPHRLEDVQERRPGREVVGDVVPDLGELVEDDVRRVERELIALVVDLLDVALGARGPDDVGRTDDPVAKPVEALLAHPLREDGHAAAAHDPRDRDSAPAVVARGRPDRAVARRVELPGDDPRRQAAVSRQHLVGVDHREAVAEYDHDAGVDAGQRLREHHVLGNRHQLASRAVVVPVDPEQVQRVRVVGTDVLERGPDVCRDQGGVGQLGERREADARLPEPHHRVLIDRCIHELPLESKSSHCALRSV